MWKVIEREGLVLWYNYHIYSQAILKSDWSRVLRCARMNRLW